MEAGAKQASRDFLATVWVSCVLVILIFTAITSITGLFLGLMD